MDEKIINVTSPLLPPLEEYVPYLKDIWERKWITNNGHYHRQLEEKLCEYLAVPHISLFSNGTLALITALQALDISGEVITTPYSFVATTHSLWWNGITPVFVDIDPATLNLDPAKIEAAITDRTTAIMPVHVYGTPCDVEAIDAIAKHHGLKVVYDAAHAFAVRKGGVSVLRYGDLSVLSFHATKTYSTVEGGAIVCHTPEMKAKIDSLKNFGLENDHMVSMYGSNAKMNELQAAFGLLSLKYIEGAIEDRRRVDARYRAELSGIPGLTLLDEPKDTTRNYSYFPIFIHEDAYGMSRDAVFQKLKDRGINARRYFYPLISDFPIYSGLPSASSATMPVAARAAAEVICIPIYPNLAEEDIARVVGALRP